MAAAAHMVDLRPLPGCTQIQRAGSTAAQHKGMVEKVTSGSCRAIWEIFQVRKMGDTVLIVETSDPSSGDKTTVEEIEQLRKRGLSVADDTKSDNTPKP